MRAAVGAWLIAAALIVAGPVSLAQQPRVTAAQDEFVPVRDLPDAEQLPAAPLVIASYGLIWVGTLAYLWFIWRRLGAVERELSTLRRDLGVRGPAER